MRLRPYQDEFNQSALAELSNGCHSTLGVLPTGTGKTVCFAHLADWWTMTRNQRVCVLAHREELIHQAAKTIGEITGTIPDIEMGEARADHTGMYTNSQIMVSSVQTLCRPNRLARFSPQDFGLVIVDEAHHCVPRNKSYNRIIEHFRQNQSLRILGVTATPDRADEVALGQMFDSVSYEYGLVDAINDGWLVPIEQFFVQVQDLDLSNVRASGGDLSDSDLGGVIGEDVVLHRIADPTVQESKGRPTLVFMPGRKKLEHGPSPSERMATILNSYVPGSASFISGDPRETSPETRAREIELFRAGQRQFLVACGIFLEGFDAPATAVIAMARPTTSRALYAQAIGRGTRPLKGIVDGLESPQERRSAIAASSKPSVLVIDFVGNSGRHKLISTADLLGGKYDDEVIEKAKKNAKPKGHSDTQGELEKAFQEVEEEKRRQRQMRFKARARYSRTQVNPFDVYDLSPCREPGWHQGRKPTEKQVAFLQKIGVPTDELSFVHASQLIGETIKRRDIGKCTYKQAKLLVEFGYSPDVDMRHASEIITTLKAHGWRRPEETLA